MVLQRLGTCRQAYEEANKISRSTNTMFPFNNRRHLGQILQGQNTFQMRTIKRLQAEIGREYSSLQGNTYVLDGAMSTYCHVRVVYTKCET